MRKLINMKSTAILTAVLAGILSGLVSQPALAESRKGLYQAFYADQNVTTGDPAASGVVIPEGAILLAVKDGSPSISATSGGVTYTVGANTTVAYKGVMKLTEGKTYTFAKNYDDSGLVRLTTPDGTKMTQVLNSGTWNEVKYGSYTAPVTGWYAIELWFGNGTGGVGPTTAPFNVAPYASLLWNDVGLTSCTAENRASWHRLVNDETEGCYLFTGVPSRAVSAEYSREGSTLTAALTIEEGEACDLYVCYGIRDAGETTNGWDHVVKVGTIDKDVTAHTDSTVTTVGTTANYVRYATYSEDANSFWFANGYSVPTRDLTPEDCVSTVVFTATKVAAGETLTDTPVLVCLSDYTSGFRYAKLFRQDHRDMLFLDAAGNVLPYDVETWNPKGESRVWVRVPTLALGTQITLKYGAVHAAINDPAQVWAGGTAYAGEATAGLVGEEPGSMEPVLADAALSVFLNTLEAQVTVFRAGLGGSGATTVAIDLGTSPENMTCVHEFDPVSASGTVLRQTLTGLSFGATYYVRFRAWSEDGQTRYETSTAMLDCATLDAMTWNGSGTDWNTASSWDGGTYPVAHLKASFPSAGGRVEATADAAAAELGVATDTPIVMAFGEHALTVGKTEFSKLKRTVMTLESGVFDFGAFSYNAAKTEDNLLTVEKDASLSVSGNAQIPTCRNRWVIDGGRLTTTGTFSISQRWGSQGNSGDSSSVTLLNGATWQAGTIKCGCWHNGRLLVLSGSTLTAGNISISNDQDSGSGNGLTVSNATVTASALTVCADDRHGSSHLRIYEDAGEKTTVTVSGDLNVASQGNSCRHGKNSRVEIAGGEVAVGGNMRVSSDPNNPVTAQNNVVALSRPSARLAVAKGVKFQRDTKVSFTVPAEGFAAADGVLTAGTTMAFSDLSTVTVDATAVRQAMDVTLLKAGTSLSGLTAERVSVLTRRNVKSTVVIDESSVIVKLRPDGLLLLVH